MNDAVRTGQHVQFKYTNWREHEHTYRVVVESFEFGYYEAGGVSTDGSEKWVMHAQVVTRDGDFRQEMDTRRRTFLLEGIRDLEVIA